jgi:hypothetical protein
MRANTIPVAEDKGVPCSCHHAVFKQGRLLSYGYSIWSADTSGELTLMSHFLTPREQRIVLVFVPRNQRQPHNGELQYWLSSSNCSAAINYLKAGKLT